MPMHAYASPTYFPTPTMVLVEAVIALLLTTIFLVILICFPHRPNLLKLSGGGAGLLALLALVSFAVLRQQG